MNNLMIWLIFLFSALLEIGGDALIRKGLKEQGILLIVLGFLALGGYGLVVNLVKWDFSRLLGVYVSVFALLSVLAGRFIFKENIQPMTWFGLILIIMGGLVIQFSQK